MKIQQRQQSGVTLIELLIAIVIGLIVLASTTGIFITSLKANSDNMKMIRLNQELQAAMTLMVRDIRRTGYWGQPTVNPFVPTIASGTVSTITFGYDADSDGVDDGTSENFGFRLNSNAVQMLDTADAWQSLTDSDVVNVTALNFNVDIWCPSDPTCTSSSRTEIRTVHIVLTAELADDSNVSRRIEEAVRIRTDSLI